MLRSRLIPAFEIGAYFILSGLCGLEAANSNLQLRDGYLQLGLGNPCLYQDADGTAMRYNIHPFGR